MNQPLLQMDLRLVGLAVLVLGAAVGVIWWYSRRVHADLFGTGGAAAKTGTGPGDAGVPAQVVKELQQRGLATPAQLARMSEMERHLLFSSMASAIKKDAGADEPARTPGVRAFIRPEELPTLYCPTCSFRIERFSSTPPLTGQCETCGARVIVRRDAGRIMLTVLPADDTTRRTDA